MSNRENINLISNYLAEVRTLSGVAINISDYLNNTTRELGRVVFHQLDNNRNTESLSPFSRSSRLSNPFTQYSPRRPTTSRPPVPLPISPRNRNRNNLREEPTPEVVGEEVVFTGLLDLSPVSVYPSITQIMNATEMHTFGEIDNPINSSCPITMDSFSPGDRVCQIKHCKHIFKERALYTWFSNHVGCPVCRFDIREDPENSNTPNESYVPSVTTTGPPVPQQLMSDITQLLSQSISRNISSTDV